MARKRRKKKFSFQPVEPDLFARLIEKKAQTSHAQKKIQEDKEVKKYLRQEEKDEARHRFEVTLLKCKTWSIWGAMMIGGSSVGIVYVIAFLNFLGFEPVSGVNYGQYIPHIAQAIVVGLLGVIITYFYLQPKLEP